MFGDTKLLIGPYKSQHLSSKIYMPAITLMDELPLYIGALNTMH